MPLPRTRKVRPFGVPAGILTVTGAPLWAGTLMSAPSAASGTVTGTVTVRLPPDRPKTGCGVTCTRTYRSPADQAARQGRPGRNPGLDGPRAGRVAAAVARLARVLDHQPPAPAGLARFREGEVAEVPARLPGAFTGRADLGHGAGLGAGAVADRAGPVAGQLERNRGPVHRIAERQGGLGLHVGAAAGPGLGSSTAATTEHAAEDAPEGTAALGAGTGTGTGTAAPEEVAEV